MTTDPGAIDYDGGWTTRWNDMRRYGPTGRHLRNIVTDLVRPLDYRTVLDVGCGQGSLLEMLIPLKPEAQYVGIDFAAKALDVARQRAPQAEFVVHDLMAPPLKRQFDLVLCTDVVEHIEDDAHAIANVAAMTGRYLIVSTLQGRMRPYEHLVGHYRNYAPGELQAKIEASGLRVKRVVEWGFPFFSPLYRDMFRATGTAMTQGTYGPLRKTAARILYRIFQLNSWRRGDYIFVLAEREA